MRTFTAASLIALATLASGLGAAEANGRVAAPPKASPVPVVRGLDAVALALASPHTPTPVERAVTVGHLHPWGAGSETESTAGATADCDGCTAKATALAVVYGNGPGRVRADNLATSMTGSCSGCGTVAVSVQVVMLRRAGTVEANNRATAVNAACTECRASSAAYQTVIVDPRGRRLSARDLAVHLDWLRDQADKVASSSPTLALRRGAGTSSPERVLDQHDDAELVANAVVVINAVRKGVGAPIGPMVEHFTRRCRRVVTIPWDPALEVGAQTHLSALHPSTRDSLVEMAAAVADGFDTRGTHS
jgi:hypothetical protein